MNKFMYSILQSRLSFIFIYKMQLQLCLVLNNTFNTVLAAYVTRTATFGCNSRNKNITTAQKMFTHDRNFYRIAMEVPINKIEVCSVRDKSITLVQCVCVGVHDIDTRLPFLYELPLQGRTLTTDCISVLAQTM